MSLLIVVRLDQQGLTCRMEPEVWSLLTRDRVLLAAPGLGYSTEPHVIVMVSPESAFTDDSVNRVCPR